MAERDPRARRRAGGRGRARRLVVDRPDHRRRAARSSAPPASRRRRRARRTAPQLVQLQSAVFRCPYCGSTDTRLENIFGPTPCRSIRYCTRLPAAVRAVQDDLRGPAGAGMGSSCPPEAGRRASRSSTARPEAATTSGADDVDHRAAVLQRPTVTTRGRYPAGRGSSTWMAARQARQLEAEPRDTSARRPKRVDEVVAALAP